MKTTITLAVGIFAAALHFASAPASAAPLPVSSATTEAAPSAETVQYGYGRRGYGGGYGRRGYGGGYGGYGRRGYGGPRYGGRGYGRGGYYGRGIGPGNLLGGGPGYIGPRF